jgi:hypothetical protein
MMTSIIVMRHKQYSLRLHLDQTPYQRLVKILDTFPL